jgi:transcriptional antiterminator Rof (Rho-off)
VGNLVGVNPTYFRDHPRINMLLKEGMKKYQASHDLKRHQEREEELLLEVESAIRELEASHRPVTQKAVGRIVGKRPENLKVYPRIQALLQQKAN